MRLAGELQPDLIILDEALPDVSGTDAAAMMQDDVSTSLIPVVIFRSSSHGKSLEADEMFEGVEVVLKPFTVSELTGILRQTVEAKIDFESKF